MIKKNLLKIIGVLLFVFILSRINFSELFEIIKNIDLFYFVLAILLLPLMLVIKGMRWNYIKSIYGINYGVVSSIIMYGSGLYIGLITPGRVGDFSKVLYLKNDGYPLLKSFFTTVVDRGFELISLFVIAYISLLFFFDIFAEFIYIITALMAMFVLIFLVLLFNNKVRKVLLKTLFFVSPRKLKHMVLNKPKEVFLLLRKLSNKRLLLLLIITLFSRFTYFIEMYFLSLAIGMNINFVYLVMAVSIAGFITLVPISVGGIGTRDAILIILFGLVAISKEVAVIYSNLILAMSFFMALIGLGCWIKKPLMIKNEKL